MKTDLMEVEDLDILHKIIETQSCIIQGRHLHTILHKHKMFYLNKTNADFITICMNDQDKVHPDYILEEHRLMYHLLKKYIFVHQALSWNSFIKDHYIDLLSNGKYFKTDDLYEVFKGILTKREASSFKDELQMNYSVLMPIYDFSKEHIIGVVCFIFCKETEPDISKLKEVNLLFQTLLQPLYDEQFRIIYQKCVRVDENFSLLTEQERRITKKVLAGQSYSEIAKTYSISINTLKTHMKNIFKKYNVNSKIELYNKLNTFT
jgi:DNA-binding CsgD family transcriptional regulator